MITGNHAIGTVRKFPTLPLNANGVWIDPTGGVWRQATDVQSIQTNGMNGEGNIPTNAPPQLPHPDYERFVRNSYSLLFFYCCSHDNHVYGT